MEMKGVQHIWNYARSVVCSVGDEVVADLRVKLAVDWIVFARTAYMRNANVGSRKAALYNDKALLVLHTLSKNMRISLLKICCYV